MEACPSCGSKRVHRSRTRGFVERLRREFTRKRPFRCHDCGWRGWGVETDRVFAEEMRTGDSAVPDLDAIDEALAKPPAETETEANNGEQPNSAKK